MMKTIAHKDIIIPENRQRREFRAKPLEELRDSIAQVGLLHPIVLRNDSRTLVIGERRIKATTLLGKPYTHDGETVPAGFVPFTTLAELNEEQLFQAELEENIRRTDLTWQERTKALARLHNFRVKQDPTHTVTETAREVRGKEDVTGADANAVTNAVILERYLDNPLIANCSDEAQARKVLKDQLQRDERRRRLAAIDPMEMKFQHKLIIGDCYESVVPEGVFDCIVTDPPYGIDMHKKETFDSDKHEYDDSEEAFQKVCRLLPKLAYRAAKENAHIYIFCDIRRYQTLAAAFRVANWQVWPRPLIWDKGNTGSFGNIEYGFRSCYDALIFCRKGDKKVTAGYRDVINITQPTNLPHPAGKPSDLYVDLLKRSCLPGDIVADFYCGHGPIFSAAQQLNLTAWGWELHETYAEMAQETLLKIKGR